MRLKSNWNLVLIFLIPILGIGLASSFASQPAACVVSDGDPNYYQVNATTIAIEPWLGEHNVYALFVVPKKYAVILNEREAIVRVKGVANNIEATPAKPSLYKRVAVPEGSAPLVSYLWTRETVWQILQGKYGELQHLCSWTLYIRL
ncbi:MAG: hypothetical protein AUK48_15400 [Oscillatoriales cyanobacterium CG2_30_44_21]|nr:MAG: hypothetical protein AUK48_15400 [Oscillatoriales cyanobacterium CG2_30_44_21]